LRSARAAEVVAGVDGDVAELTLDLQ
jgi:hypothetical protein